MTLSIIFPSIDPVCFALGPLEVRWYGIAYSVSIMICYFILRAIYGKEYYKFLDDLFFFTVLGIVIGGRLGYIVFYQIDYIWLKPIEILKIWRGGMSFHGGLLGSAIGIYRASRKHKLSFLYNCDNIVVLVPIGLFFGRIANFINNELWGRVTTVPWGIVTLDGVVRHPSQIYEAITEGLLLFIILLYNRKRMIAQQGKLTGLFLTLYGLFRIFMENYREPDDHIGLAWQLFSRGQFLSMPVTLLGLFLLFFYKKKSSTLLK